MKRLALAALLAASSACWVESNRARGPAATDFYGELAPYGAWVDLAPYGAVWQPSPRVVGADFYPYFSNGYWVDTESGWSWQSEWSWGWIPFHHGRWVAAPQYGWVWVPGDEWAPAWVEWRVGGGNVGWVPLGPQGVATVFRGYQPRWCFVPLAHFGRHDFQRWRVPAYQEYSAYHAATSIPFERGNWRRGPSEELVRRAGGQVTRAAEPPRQLRRGDVKAEPRVGPQARRPPPPPPPGSTLPPPPPMTTSRPEGAQPAPMTSRPEVMPPPPGAAAPAPTLKPPPAKQKQQPATTTGRARKPPPVRPAPASPHY